MVEIYAVDAHAHQQVAIWAVAVTAVVSALIMAARGRRSWWLVLLAAFVVPTAVALTFGARPDGGFMAYLVEAVLPMGATLGVVSGVLGAMAGLGLRWPLRRLRR